MATINMHMKFEIEIPKQTWLMLRKPCRLQTDGRTDRRTDKVNPVYPPSNFVGRGYNKITKSGRSFTGSHLVQSASLPQNSPKIFHTVFETLPVGAKLLPILTPDYCHPSQSNFTECKQDMVAVFYAPVNGQWVNQQALYFLGLSELTHVCEAPCMTGQLPSQLTKDCQPSGCTDEHYVSFPRMEHMPGSTCLLNWGKMYGYSYIWHNTEHCQIGWSILLFIFISEFIFD